MLFLILVLLVALGVLSPYISVILKRRKMLRRICFVARQSGFRVRRLHRFVCFSFNRGKGYDLLFECKTYAYAVKLWSAVRKNTILTVRGGRISETGESAVPLDTGKTTPVSIRGKEKKVPVTRNNFKVRNGKQVTNVLICYPSYRQVITVGTSGQKTVASKDVLFDKLFVFPGVFEKMLNENVTDNTKIAEVQTDLNKN